MRGELEVSLTARDAGRSGGSAMPGALPVRAGRCWQVGAELKQPGDACEEQRDWMTELGRQTSNICSQLRGKARPVPPQLRYWSWQRWNGQHQVLSTALTGPGFQLWQTFQFSQQWDLIPVICSLLSHLSSSHLKIFIYFLFFFFNQLLPAH